jgi:hypothetical protein
MRPKGITETAIAMCVMNIAGFVFVAPEAGYVALQFALFGVVITLTFPVLWYYWKGKRWARVLVLIGGAIAVLNIFAVQSVGRLAAALIVVEAVFAIFMFWWLNTQNVRAYFKSVTEPAQGAD